MWALYEVPDESRRTLESTGEEAMAILTDSDLLAARIALGSVAMHRKDCYYRAWEKLQEASEKALENDS